MYIYPHTHMSVYLQSVTLALEAVAEFLVVSQHAGQLLYQVLAGRGRLGHLHVKAFLQNLPSPLLLQHSLFSSLRSRGGGGTGRDEEGDISIRSIITW